MAILCSFKLCSNVVPSSKMQLVLAEQIGDCQSQVPSKVMNLVLDSDFCFTQGTPRSVSWKYAWKFLRSTFIEYSGTYSQVSVPRITI